VACLMSCNPCKSEAYSADCGLVSSMSNTSAFADLCITGVFFTGDLCRINASVPIDY
jgi:hypothetical protein